MVNYPAKIDNTVTLPTAVDNVTAIRGIVVNRLRDAILAIESELGVKPSGTSGTVAARLTFIENAIVSGSNVIFSNDLLGTATAQSVVGFNSIPLTAGTPTAGQAYIYDGSHFTLGTDFHAQNISTSGQVSSSGLVVTGTAIINAFNFYGGPHIAYGTGVPSLTGIPNGSIFLREDGTGSTGVYTYQSGAWTAIGGGGGGFTAGGDLSGNSTSQNVIRIQNFAVSPVAPLDSQVLTWDQADGYWHAVTPLPSLFPFGPDKYVTAPPTIASGMWTLFNPVASPPLGWVAATIQDHPAGYGVQITANGSGSHECFAGIFQARGSNTQWTAQIDAPIFDTFGAGGPSPFVAMSIYDSVANKAVNFGIATSGTAPILIVNHQDYPGLSTTTPTTSVIYHSPFPIWLRIIDTGSNYQFYYSYDGVTFIGIYQESRTAFLSAAGNFVGVGVEVNNASNPSSGNTHASLWLGSWKVGP